jgi:hypothetical protein
LQGSNLYHLRIEELDGTHSYSTTRMIQMNETTSDIVIYPNSEQQEINVVLQDVSNTNVDALGRIIQKGKIYWKTRTIKRCMF